MGEPKDPDMALIKKQRTASVLSLKKWVPECLMVSQHCHEIAVNHRPYDDYICSYPRNFLSSFLQLT